MMTKLSFLPGPTRRAPRFLMSSVAVLGLAFGAAACGDDDDGDPADGVNAPFNTTGRVTISGTPMVGETLTAMVTDANGVSGTVAYQWAAGGTDIDGATAETYVLTLAEVGETMTVTASYTDDDGFTESIMSTSTAAVEGIPNIVGMVSIAGIPTVGQTLTASLTDDNGLTTATPAYQWQAGGTAITGATGETYVLTLAEDGAMITVTVTYTDDGGNTETLTSNALGPVSTDIVNVPGTVEISGTNVVGEMLSADITDANGATGAVTYQWAADGTDVDGATGRTFTLTADQRGQTMSVTVSYTDDNDFVEGPLMATDDDIVYTVITTDETSLLAAAAAAVEGDAIGIGDGTYADMEPVDFAADGLLVRRVTGGDAVITGTTCIAVSGANSVMDGLIFEELGWAGTDNVCFDRGDGSVVVFGSNNVVRNCEFRSEADDRGGQALGTRYHYMTVGGVGQLIERNLFEGKDTNGEGSAISIFSNDDDTMVENHIVQFNLFRNFEPKPPESGESVDPNAAHALQVGRDRGTRALGEENITIRFNRFDNIRTVQRLLRVQTSSAFITGNTVVSSLGLVALEDGFGNTVNENIFLSNGDEALDGDDGAIRYAPLGHVITNNYMSNLRTTSGDGGGIVLDLEFFEDGGNVANRLLLDEINGSTRDGTVEISNNTIVNSRQAIVYEDDRCERYDVGTPTVSFVDNFVSNADGTPNGNNRAVIRDSDFVVDGCPLNASFTGNHFYSETLSNQDGSTLTLDNTNTIGGEILGTENGGADIVTDPETGLVDGSGPDEGVGVDTSILTIIDETMVGPGSTWVPES
ncbi:MAG: chondroitinase-B domain-containing protein [Myxococcota bacterium]